MLRAGCILRYQAGRSSRAWAHASPHSHPHSCLTAAQSSLSRPVSPSPAYMQAPAASTTVWRRSSVRLMSSRESGTFSEHVVGSNPMFPQRPPPPPPPGGDGGGKDGGNDGFAPDFEESWLSRNSGKVGMVALIMTVSMVTSYYKSYRSRVDFVEQLTAGLLVEPHEINDVRFGSVGMTPSAFLAVAQAAAAAATPTAAGSSSGSGQDQGQGQGQGHEELEITYREFMRAIAGVLQGTHPSNTVTIRAGRSGFVPRPHVMSCHVMSCHVISFLSNLSPFPYPPPPFLPYAHRARLGQNRSRCGGPTRRRPSCRRQSGRQLRDRRHRQGGAGHVRFRHLLPLRRY